MSKGRLVVACVMLVACSDDPTGPGGSAEWVQLAVGDAHACALTSDGSVFCWGATHSGQTGQSTGPVMRAARVDTDIVFEQIEAGGETTCGVSVNETLHCWGSNALGQLGDGSGQNSNRPVTVAGGLTWTTVSVGTYHVCGIDTEGRVHCWGGDRWDSLIGYPATEECVAPAFAPTWPCQPVPLTLLSLGNFDWVEAGLYHNCAGTAVTGALCWGTNDLGQLGTSVTRTCAGNDPLHPSSVPCSPSPVPPDGPTMDHAAPGATHMCGRAGNEIYCWGALHLNFGQLGDGTFDGAAAPTAVAAGGPWRAVFTSHGPHIRTFSCGIEEGGSALCWGANRFGQLGSTDAPTCAESTVPCRDTPTPVEGGYSFSELGLGVEFACGLTTDNEILCWGQNSDGQLGDGTLSPRYQPAEIAF